MALLALLRQSNGIVPSAPRVALAASLGRVAPTRTTALAATAAQVPTFVTDHRASRGGARVMVSNVKEVLPKFRSEFRRPRRIKDRGRAVLLEPLVTKGTCFPDEERDRLNLRGLLPPRPLTLETQVKKNLKHLRECTDPMDKFMCLSGLQDRNETIFFKLLIENMEELAPYVYTPTVGVVCEKFGVNFRRPRGMYFSTQDRGLMGSMVYNWPKDNVQVIVVTDGSRILGLGDLGANGMGIPIGKLALYTAAGGIPPDRVLPIMLDCGTNNPVLRNDEFYLGMKHDRLTGEEHFSVVAELMDAIKNRWPKALIQFEDFSTNSAAKILQHYRSTHLCFNDDIQGTGATTLAGVMAAVKAQGEGLSLSEQRIVVLGAGSAGIGVATTLMQGMVHESGLTAQQAQEQFWVLDDRGLLTDDREGMDSGQQFFARDDMKEGMSLIDVIKQVKPTILLGLTGVPGLFKEEHIREMAKHNTRPIIFPLSNPTIKAECTAEQAFKWTDGRAIVASGSPFEPVEVNGKMCYPSQCNNMFIFPGVGLGATFIGAQRITDRMFYRAAKALAKCVTEEELAQGKVFPSVSNIRDVSLEVAVAVCKSALHDGLTSMAPPADLHEYLRSQMYVPEYRPLVVEE